MVVSLDDVDFETPGGFAELFKDDRPPPLPEPLCTSLEDASREGSLAAVKDIYTEIRRIFPRHTTKVHTGGSLINAIENQHVEIVDYLLSQNVDVRYWEVMRAIRIKNTAILELLFEKAWDINKAFGFNDPPALAYAVMDPDLTAWFLAHGADPHAGCPMDTTPLSIAVRDAPFSIVEMLLAYSGTFERGQLLHWAVCRKLDDRTRIIELLLHKGLPVNAVECHNQPHAYRFREAFGDGTALHTAAASGSEDALRVLISYGARFDIKDSHGYLPVERAEANGHYGAVTYLREVESKAFPRL